MRIRVSAVDEIEDAAIVANDVFDEQLRLAPHRQPQVILEIGEAIAIAGDRFEGAELQPLPAELFGERVGFGIAQHAPDLCGQHFWIAKRPGVRDPSQFCVRHARPQEVGQPAGQFMLRDGVR